MEKHIIYQRIGSILEDMAKQTNLLHAMSSTDIRRYMENYEVLAIEAATKSERITCKHRHLIFQSTRIKKRVYMETAAAAMGITVTSDEGVLNITLPALMPNRKSSQATEYLLDPLYYALGDYMDGQDILPRYMECVVHFTHVYDRCLPGRRIRDYDNLESKQVLDVVTAFCMVDDGGLDCDVYQTNQLGERDCTLISVMEKDAFPYWQLAQKYGKNISDVKAIFGEIDPI